jgi:hypothetical protein
VLEVGRVVEGGRHELGDEVKRQLVNIFGLVGQWRGRVQSVPSAPAAGSSLRKLVSGTAACVASAAPGG